MLPQAKDAEDGRGTPRRWERRLEQIRSHRPSRNQPGRHLNCEPLASRTEVILFYRLSHWITGCKLKGALGKECPSPQGGAPGDTGGRWADLAVRGSLAIMT